MKFRKRLGALALSAALTLGLLTGTAGAYRANHAGGHFLDNVYTEGVDGDAEAEAVMLQKLGLFQGAGDGFDLESPLTRGQAAVLLTRLFGQEAAALADPPAHPFTDVPAWADAQVGWLYEHGLTRGVGGNQYAAAQPIRYRDYAAMLVRALEGPDVAYEDWTLLGAAEEEEFFAQFPAFPRSAAVGLTIRALLQSSWDRGETLLAQLYEDGLFTAEALRDASYGILPAEYHLSDDGALCRYVGGIEVARCEVAGLTPVADSLDLPQDVLYATKRENGGLSIYELRCDTLEVNRQGRAPSPDAVGVSQVGGWDSLFCLAELLPGDEGPVYGALLGWPETGVETYWTAQALWAGEAVPAGEGRFQIEEGRLLVQGGGQLRLMEGKKCLSLPWPGGSALLSYDGSYVVGAKHDDGGTLTLFVLDAATGETRQSLDVPPADLDGDGTLEPLSVHPDGWYFVGSAGAFSFQDGVLARVLEAPTVQVALTRMLWPYFLTYTPGVSPLYEGRQTGDGVYTLDQDGAPVPILTAESGHGVRFLELTGDSTVTGLAPDGTAYSYFVLQNTLGVIGPLEENLSEAELTAVITRERDRLIAAGVLKL